MFLFNTKCSRAALLAVLLLPFLSPSARAQSLVAQRPFLVQTVTFSATPTFDASKSPTFKITLTGNVTSSTLTSAEDGMLLIFTICQDATGSRTFVWPTQLQGTLAILATANSCTTEMFHYSSASNTAINPTTQTGGGGGGTVTSVALSAPTGFQVSGSPVTTSGTLTLSMPVSWAAGDILYGNGANSVARLAGATGILHNNGTTPSWAAVNLAGADVTGALGFANGGTNGASRQLGLNALSGMTAAGQLLLYDGTNVVSLNAAAAGSCLTTTAGTPFVAWGSCAAGAVTGSGGAAQGTFWATATSLTGSANWTYTAASGHVLTQGANGADAFKLKRNTDVASAGTLLIGRNAADTSTLFSVDVSGNVTAVSFTATGPCNGGTAGCEILTQGTAPSLTINGSITLHAPTAVTDYRIVLPGVSATGFLRGTNSANVNTLSFAAASGVGSCANTVVTAVNDNAAPTCSPITSAMFGTVLANLVLAAPSGANGVPTFRALVGADIPAINLNGTGNGGVSGTLPTSAGGCNATTALGCFNNISPLTTLGDVLAYNGTSNVRVAGNITTTNKYLRSVGTGAVSALPSFEQVAYADVSGTPTLFYQTVQANATAQTQRPIINLISGTNATVACVDNAGATKTDCTFSASSTAGARLDQITAPTIASSINTGDFGWTRAGALTTASNFLEELTEQTAATSTGTPKILYIHTLAASTAHPLLVTARGTANGIDVDPATGSLAAIGTADITATKLSRTVNTTSPLGGGGVLTADLTLTCTTCATASAALGNNAVVLGSGGGQGTKTSTGITTDGAAALTLGVNAATTGTLLLANGGALGVSVTLQNLGATTAYNFNLPATPGTSGQFLTSAAGGTNSMTWSAPTGTAPVVYSGGVISITGSAGGVLAGAGPAFTATPTLGVNATTAGTLGLANGGATGATITLQNLGATAAYNFNLPVGAGSSGQPLLSGGGASASMTFGTLGVAAGGTASTTFTAGLVRGSGTSALTGAELSGDATTSGSNAVTLASKYKVRSCEIVVGDPGAASSVLADDNDTPDVCSNDSGATLTITAVHCYAPVGSPTVTPIITGGTATSILTGALTCTSTQGGAAGTLNGTPTQTNTQTVDGNITTAGGTAKYLVIRVTYSF